MEIADRDLKMILLRKAICANRQFVIKKLIKLEKTKKENNFLETIYDDYKKYYNYMIAQKMKQAAQMNFLVDYLEKSITAAGLTKGELSRARYEQDNILAELDNIRDDLEAMIY